MYRYRNQIAYVYELCRAKFKFVVASQIFTIHKGIKKKLTRNEKFYMQENWEKFFQTWNNFEEMIKLKYPNTEKFSVASSRFSNPQRTFATETISIGTTNLPSTTTTTSTIFIQPIEQTTSRRPFGRFVLSEAKAVDLKDLRNRTGILAKIIKQQKIFDELIRDSTLTTRNLPFTTPGEDKLIVDKRLQKLDETVKRFRTATPPFGFQLVSSIPTKRPTRSTTQFLSTQLLGRNTVAAQGVVDRDLANPSRTTSTPSTTTADGFRKFERILPKRILGNDFRQIVFPTTTSTRSTRSTTTNDSNLLIVDGQAFGDHFVFNSLPQPNLQDVIFGKVPTISSSSTSLSPVTIPLSSAKPLLPLKERNRQLKRKIFFFRNRHSGEMVIINTQ
uniref:Uncharacterized protein n=1 Tax=Panagrolaimus davidi TaxID=227884 RepID=A0A914PWE7_9BILA